LKGGEAMERKELKLLRKMNKLTLEDVGKKLGVSKATVQRYESGEIELTYDRICQLAEIYNVNPGYLFPDNSGKRQDEDIESQLEKAIELYKKYKEATHQVQDAVEILLRKVQPDS
jgi:transcriptional regulator with XRE-family HTH domain